MLNSIVRKIAIIGCGNVAWHLCEKFHKLKNTELFVYNHKANKALAAFKEEFGADVNPSIKEMIDADAYFICVSDSAIDSVISKLTYLPVNSHVLVTSGSFDLSTLKTKLKNLAIFYPLQSFTKKDEVKWKDITIVLDPLNTDVEQKALGYANYLSDSVIKLNYQQRLKLHLSAVLVNNFTNSLFAEADKLMHSIRKDLDITLLLPLIKQSAKKLKHLTPLEAQTGPAKRNDKEVMKKHLSVIKTNKNLSDVYVLLSKLIAEQQK
jgi:predicted short-subunit dehydrogenase-like oxidoreductase (DUF2520 family)